MTPTPGADRSHDVKQAILRSARELFTERGFDSTGIRDIAADAAVNPAIVIRHFESKERLFLTSVDAAESLTHLLNGPLDRLGHEVVRVVMQERGRPGQRIFAATVRASGRTDVRAHLAGIVADIFVDPLKARITLPDAEVRAHLFAAQLVGILCALEVYDDRFLQTVEADRVLALYGASLQRLLTGPATGDAPATA
ncbi:TetR family transcriptional regulator [Microbacterium sp. zg.Y1090]|uniref:TetR/AcrR family transcriptional regulator n=1 Tax=Microbacterium TaxID=33882 RepID=UPI00214C11FB|nr:MULTISPECIES: TetR/AcrR family transcriptional regulator [unclassified Microbacterium]MCR2812354.1 TetR family transcriptional regulator [Microbacterium sp. zg.Y1084]MCR2817845.1 TetR family transcriptional regulator [Microbacterium sp. zg.Y1090]MDL5485511.1 TetR family transcriptional regulator [Microbacterium sp. zg-Y1211]WIM28683.1 TetR family transcriptional regulator [Microbacterium sp. zg-Y1090]